MGYISIPLQECKCLLYSDILHWCANKGHYEEYLLVYTWVQIWHWSCLTRTEWTVIMISHLHYRAWTDILVVIARSTFRQDMIINIWTIFRGKGCPVTARQRKFRFRERLCVDLTKHIYTKFILRELHQILVYRKRLALNIL